MLRCALGETRTPMVLLPLAPEASVSTNSTTKAFIFEEKPLSLWKGKKEILSAKKRNCPERDLLYS